MARLDGKPLGSINVSSSKLYTVYNSRVARDGLLELRFTRGVRAYSFTFG